MRRLPLIVFVLTIVADQVTKAWAQSRLALGVCTPETCVPIFGGPARFRLIHNTGAAFSAAEGYGWVLAPISITVGCIMLVISLRTRSVRSAFGLALVAGGAIGNVIDRFVRSADGFASGGVVDFVDLRFWPIFNVADVAVVSGIGLLLFTQRHAEEQTPSQT